MGGGYMDKLFSNFINKCLKVLMCLTTIVVAGSFLVYWVKYESLNIKILIVFSITTSLFLISVKKRFNNRVILVGIIIFAFLLRLLWVLSIDSLPTSDFQGMYERSELFLKGEYYIFKGDNYYARFPHLTIPVLYYAFIRYISPIPLVTLKLINVISSTIGVFICYLIGKEVFNSYKKAICIGYVSAIYPATISYTATYCPENIAITFYLISIYYFILVMKGKKTNKYLLLSGLVLFLGNLFRMVASVVIIAYLIYIVIYFKKQIKDRFVAGVFILLSFIIPLIIISNILKYKGITEYDLWKGSESPWTSILKGSNMSSFGRWNEEDAKLVSSYNGDYCKTEEAAKDIVEKRYTQVSLIKLIEFFTVKYTFQWREGDFGGVYWSQYRVGNNGIILDLEENGQVYIQLVYLILNILTYIGLYNKKQHLNHPIINIFYIIYCGYGLLYLITESQDRYSFIVSWLFIILAFTAFNEQAGEYGKFNNNSSSNVL